MTSTGWVPWIEATTAVAGAFRPGSPGEVELPLALGSLEHARH